MSEPEKPTKINRRQLAALLLTAAAGSGAAWYWTGLTGSKESLTFALPEPDSALPPSFEVFLALSRIVTCRDSLDETVARRLYGVFLDEPWGPEHIASVYSDLRKAILSGADAKDQTQLHSAARLGKGQTWFASHLLTTWYLGIYYHETRPTQRICWEEALMYDAVRDVLPIWFTGPREEDHWVKDPSEAPPR